MLILLSFSMTSLCSPQASFLQSFPFRQKNRIQWLPFRKDFRESGTSRFQRPPSFDAAFRFVSDRNNYFPDCILDVDLIITIFGHPSSSYLRASTAPWTLSSRILCSLRAFHLMSPMKNSFRL